MAGEQHLRDTKKATVPRLGILTVLAVIASAVLATLPLDWGAVFEHSSLINWSTFQIYTGMGAAYGLVAAGCWFATCIRNRWIRHGVRFLLVLAAAYPMATRLGDSDISTLIWQVTIFGGMAIGQCVAFFYVRVPEWRFWKSPAGQQRAQFSIGEILLGTGCTALLLSIAIRRETPVSQEFYWPWMICVFLMLPTTWGLACSSVLRQPLIQRFAFGIAATAAIAVGAMLLANAEGWSQSDVATNYSTLELTYCYGVIMTASTGCVTAIGVAGRIDGWLLEKPTDSDS